MGVLSIFLNSHLSVLREARWTGLFLFFAPARSHALYYYIISVEHVLRSGSHDLIYIISVEHVLRPGCSLFYFYFIFIFILLYFNASIILYLPLLKTKPKDSVIWYVMIDFWTIRNLKVFCNIGILYYRRFIGVLYFGNLWSTF